MLCPEAVCSVDGERFLMPARSRCMNPDRTTGEYYALEGVLMRRYAGLFVLILSMAVAVPSELAASEDMPTTFSECVLAGGQIRGAGDEISCREIRSYDVLTYMMVTTECGEEVHIETLDEIRRGVVTYRFEPARTMELPEVGGESTGLPPGTPIPCLP